MDDKGAEDYLCVVLKRVLHIVCSLWLALLLLFGNTPKDFVHAFTGHQDTVHRVNDGKQGAVIEQEHHHCSFLDFHLLPFAHEAFFFVPQPQAGPFFIFTDVPATTLPLTAALHTALRGPPVS